MAGFFGFFDFTKEGPGVEADEPLEPWHIRYFKVYARNFWTLVKSNLLYVLFSIPLIFLVYIIIGPALLMWLFPGTDIEVIVGFGENQFGIFSMIFYVFMFCSSIFAIGPVQAGITYLHRNVARDRHVFVWSDFFENFKKNWKQSLVVCIVDLLILYVFAISFNFYGSSFGTGSMIYTIAFFLIIFIFVIYLMAHMYIYPMIVTFKMKLRVIYKNSFLLAGGMFIKNILILLLTFAVTVIVFFVFPLGISVLIFVFLLPSWFGYTVNFMVWGVFEKYIILNQEKEEAEAEIEEENQSEEK